MSSKDESGFDSWAGLKLDLNRAEIWAVDVDGNRERAPVFQAVIEAMRSIPYSPEREGEIKAGAWNICSAAMVAGMENQPNLQLNRGGTAKDVEEMINVHDLCFELAHSLHQLHRGSREALEKDDQRGLRQFQREVAKWSDRAAEAWSALEAGEQQPSIKGAPTKDIEAAVRRVALREFEHLTDEQVAPKHPDYKALEEFFYLLFDALNLDPKNAVSQARTAVEERDTASDL